MTMETRECGYLGSSNFAKELELREQKRNANRRSLVNSGLFLLPLTARQGQEPGSGVPNLPAGSVRRFALRVGGWRTSLFQS